MVHWVAVNSLSANTVMVRTITGYDFFWIVPTPVVTLQCQPLRIELLQKFNNFENANHGIRPEEIYIDLLLAFCQLSNLRAHQENQSKETKDPPPPIRLYFWSIIHVTGPTV